MTPNKSLDASGIGGLVIDNLPVTQLSPAASTQPFGGLPATPFVPSSSDDLERRDA